VVVSSGDGSRQVPLGQTASVSFVAGPSMIRDEDGLLTTYIYVDTRTSDTRSWIGRAQEFLVRRVTVPVGYSFKWSGEYEEYERTRRRILWVAPLTLLLVCGLIFSNTRSAVQTGIVLLAVPFSCIGAVWMLYLAGYHLSLPVWTGLIALVGVDAPTGVFMLLYLDLAWTAAAPRRPPSRRPRCYGGDRSWSGTPNPAEVHDGSDDVHWLGANFVGERHGVGRDETHRGAGAWRPRNIVSDGIARVPGAFCDVESSEKWRRRRSRPDEIRKDTFFRCYGPVRVMNAR